MRNAPNMCRKVEFASKTVSQGCFGVTHDENRYVKSAVKTFDSSGFVVDSKAYSGELINPDKE